MDNIKKLEELKNELKILSNKKRIEYNELENLFSKLQMEIAELEDLIAEINENQCTLFIFESLYVFGIIISIRHVCLDKENSSYFLIAFIIIFVINSIKYVKGIIEYSNKSNMLDDIKDERDKIIMDGHSIQRDIDQLRNEIDNIYEIIKVNDEEQAKDYIEKSSRNLKLINDMENM